MALARSASGPGGLSINTGSANLFGNSASAPPAAGSLFGTTTAQPQASQAAPSSNLFAAASTTPKPTNLFGASTAATTSQPQQAGSLFGSTPANAAATTTSQPAAAGIFGSAPAAQSQQQSTGNGLFSSLSNTNQQQQQPQQQQQQQQAGGLFGSTLSAAAQPQQQTNPFGASTANASQPQQQSNSLFGLSQPTQPAQNSGGFGSSLLGGNQPTSGPFGAPLNTQPINPLGSTLSQQQTVPGVRIDLSLVRGTTRFNDLQEDLQKQIQLVDEQIQSYISQKNELDAFMPGHGEMLSNIPNGVKFVQTKYDGVQNALRSDAQAIEQVQNSVNQGSDHARLSFRAIDNLKLPTQYHAGGLWASRAQQTGSANTEADGQDIVNYFSKAADDMNNQLQRYESSLSEIELHLGGLRASLGEQLNQMMATKNGGASSAGGSLAELGAVLHAFEQSILNVAQEVGGAREGMTRLQLGDFLPNGNDRGGVY